MSGTAKHFDEGKPSLQWLPYDSLVEITKVFDYGKEKYGLNGNYKYGMLWSRMTGSVLRHVYRWMNGEDNDPESGLHHLAHAGACVMMLLYFVKHHPNLDDRRSDIDASNDTSGHSYRVSTGDVNGRSDAVCTGRTDDMGEQGKEGIDDQYSAQWR